LPRGLEPVHSGHVQIHQDEIESAFSAGGDRLGSVSRDLHRVSVRLQMRSLQFLIDRGVLHEKDPSRGPMVRIDGRRSDLGNRPRIVLHQGG